MKKNAVIDYYRKVFTKEKVKTDLLSHLQWGYADCFDGAHFVFEVSDCCGKETSKEVRVSVADDITIYKYESSYEFDVDLYFNITVAIGRFRERNERGFYGVEKCDAELKYNGDFSLYDIEFSYCGLTELSAMDSV